MNPVRMKLPLIMILISVLLLTGCSVKKEQILEYFSALDAAPDDAAFSVTFLDVGQADAAVIQSNGHYMLIDGGNKDDSSLIYRYLLMHDISHLDLVIGTHADEDHIGGLGGAFHFADANQTLCSADTYDSDAFRDFKTYAILRGGGITIPSAGSTYPLGDALVEILSVNASDESNDTSIVAKITYGETSFLFTGDAESATEQFLMNSESVLDADVLKVAHHGSKDSTSGQFLEHVNPQYAVISVGKDNPYGHPADMVLERLKTKNSTVLRTDRHGDILFTSDGETLTCYTEYPFDTDTNVTRSDTAADTALLSDKAASAYVLNLRSKKFHLPACDSVAKMSVQNRMDFFGNRNEVIELGYAPCGGCKP